MANNRMRVVCTVCGPGEYMRDSVYIGKRMCDGYYTIHSPSKSDFDDFYDRHTFCGGTQDHFAIQYECEADTI
jgi:hypothetical protein